MRQWVLRSTNVVLVVLGCFFAAQAVVAFLAETTLPAQAVVGPVSATVDGPGRPRSDVKTILERNLFGAKLDGEVEEPEPKEEELVAVETKLPLQLLGTIASNDEMLSNAAIHDRGTRKHQVVFVGDTLDAHPRVEVVAIRRGTVFLQNGPKRERLDLREENAQQARRPARPARRNKAAGRGARGKDRTSLAKRVGNLQQNQNKRTTSGLYSQARIVPEWEDGKMVGVRLNQVKAGSLYDQVGIESGDVIKSLNGIEIDSPQASSRLLTEFARADEFEIELGDGELIEVDSEELSEMLENEE
ncbi:MAG: type II secretion system protein GspC [Myxococcota bacterium]|nr:type II secretion system protein GspC [Myxococcota bacterium]